jgi:integrase
MTDERINRLPKKDKRYAVYDPACPGLAIRVTPRGHKTFVLGGRYPGKSQFSRVELGQAGRLTLEQARAKARQWGEWIARGVDPRDEEVRLRKEAETAAALAVTHSFLAVAEEFIARGLRGQRKAATVAREIRTELVPHWGLRPITEITRADVARLIGKIVTRSRTGAYAHNILGHVRQLFAWAIEQDVYGLQASPYDRIRPKKLIGKKKSRDHVLNDDELVALWRAAAKTAYPLGPVVQVLLLTGCRLSEVTDAVWPEFALTGVRPLWTIPAERFKQDAQHLVPLTADLVAALKALPRWPHSDFLFSRDGTKPVEFTSKAKKRVDRRMLRTLQALARRAGEDPNKVKLRPWVLHDLRRTMRTRLGELRVPEPIAEMVIGHAKKGLVRVYDQHKYQDQIREALTAWNARLRTIINPPPDNVVSLREERTSS